MTKVTFYLIDGRTKEFSWLYRGDSEIWHDIKEMVTKGIPDDGGIYIMPSQIKEYKIEKIKDNE
jgi:hypothetical protein